MSRPTPVPAPSARLAIAHRTGDLEVRLARGDEVTAALALRYDVFYAEMGAPPLDPDQRLDEDRYDAACDHLIAIDHAAPGAPIVGTYRLLRESVADTIGGFYSAGEYDLSPLRRASAAARGNVQLLELGRSCVAPAYRTNAVITLLWRAIASYLEAHAIGFLFGCASFPGTDPAPHRADLSYLAHFHLAPEPLRARVHAGHRIDAATTLAVPPSDGRGLPPLIKAYLRVGAQVGDGAYIDHAFNTIDVFMVMPVERIVGRYARRFGVV